MAPGRSLVFHTEELRDQLAGDALILRTSGFTGKVADTVWAIRGDSYVDSYGVFSFFYGKSQSKMVVIEW